MLTPRRDWFRTTFRIELGVLALAIAACEAPPSVEPTGMTHSGESGDVTKSGTTGAFTNGGSIPILLYHSWGNPACDPEHSNLMGLAADLETIADKGFTVVPAGWIADWVRGTRDASEMPPRPVGLTFDDGFDADWNDDVSPCGNRSVRTILESFRAAHAATLPSYSPHATFFVIAAPEARQSIAGGSMSETWWAAANGDPMFDVQNHSSDHDHDSIHGVYASSLGISLSAGGYADQPPSFAANSSFEAPHLAGSPSNYAYAPTDAGPWVFGATAGITGNGSLMSEEASAVGDQVGFIQGSSFIYQDNVSFPATSSGRTTIMFVAIQRPSNHDQGMQIQVSVDATVVGTFTPPPFSSGAWGTYVADVEVPPGPHRVTFAGINSPGEYDNTILLDDVQIPSPWVGQANFARINNYLSSHNEIVQAATYIQGKTAVWPRLFAYPYGLNSAYTSGSYFPSYGGEHHTDAAFCTESASMAQTYAVRGSPVYCIPRFVFGSSFPPSGTQTWHTDLRSILDGARP